MHAKRHHDKSVHLPAAMHLSAYGCRQFRRQLADETRLIKSVSRVGTRGHRMCSTVRTIKLLDTGSRFVLITGETKWAISLSKSANDCLTCAGMPLTGSQER